MKVKSFFAIVAAGIMAVACQKPGDTFTPEFNISGADLQDGKLYVQAEGANAELTVKSNVSWSVEVPTGCNWLTVTPEGVDTDKVEAVTTVKITVNENTSFDMRESALRFIVKEEKFNATITVRQNGASKPETKFQVLDDDLNPVSELNVDAKNASASVIVNSNVSWAASSSEAWCTVSPASAVLAVETPTVVTIACEDNTDSKERTATVTFNPAEGDPVAVTVKQAGKKVYSFTITDSDITATSFIVTFKCSDAEAYFLPSVETEWYEKYNDKAELAAADLAYWKQLYGTRYAEFGFDSFEDLFFNGLAVQDEYEWDMDGEADPETTYHAYAFVVNEDYTVGSDVFNKDITTTAQTLEFYGNAIWHDVFVSAIFNMEGAVLDMPCDVYTDASTPGVFYFDAPYNYANIASWFNKSPEEMKQYTGNWKRVTIAIDCSDPEEVAMPIQALGCSLNSNYGWISGGFGYGYQVDSYGVYADNTITFAADGRTVLWSMEKYNEGKTYGGDLAEDFTITITKGGSPVYPDAVAKAYASSKGVKKAARKAFVSVKEANFVELR